MSCFYQTGQALPSIPAQRMTTGRDYDRITAIELQKHPLMHQGTDYMIGLAEWRRLDNNHCLTRRAPACHRPPLL